MGLRLLRRTQGFCAGCSTAEVSFHPLLCCCGDMAGVAEDFKVVLVVPASDLVVFPFAGDDVVDFGGCGVLLAVAASVGACGFPC